MARFKPLRAGLAGASLLALAGAASAQSHGGAPGFGEVEYSGAPASLAVRAGGALSLDALGCSGFSTVEPTAVVEITRAGPLYLAAGSDLDLTLAVRGPDGTALCADDEAGALNPGVMFEDAAPGRYEVWVGTFSAGEGYPPTVLHATPDAFDVSNPYIVSPDPDLPGAQTLRLAGGFRDDPRTMAVSAGGPARLQTLDGSCWGRTSAAPSAVIDYRGGSLPLHLLLQSDADAGLAVVTPSGAVRCDTVMVDGGAGVRLESPEAGRYAVFASLFEESSDRTAPATLSVSEIGFGGVDRRLDVAGEPVFGAHRLEGGFLPDPAVYEVRAGGPADLSVSLADVETAEGYCTGHASRTPSLRLTYDGAGPLHVSMVSETDTTLAVNGPDGRWSCNDDGLDFPNPAVSYADAAPGVYDIYAATFSDADEPAPATVYVSEIGPGADPFSSMMDYALEASEATLALQPGFDPAAGRFALTAGGPAEPVEYSCSGAYPQAPHVELDWGGGPLVLATEGEADTTLAVNLPDGSWACDDDGGDGLLSSLVLDGEVGVYDIWVGTYGGDPAPAVLVIAEPQG